jgi:tetratricopeptide (TPR) repeat protein
LLVIGLGIYANSFNNELFWDDDDMVVNNEYIKDWSYFPEFFTESLISGAGQTSNYYRPLILITFAVDYHIWGLNPIGYHITNTLFHIIVAFLLFLLVYKLQQLSCGTAKNKYILAFLVSLIFLVHPLQTEAVTYVAGRGDPLSAIFSLLAILFYINFRTSKGGIKYLGGGLLFFVLGLLVKEQVIFLPALVFLVEMVFFAGKGSREAGEESKGKRVANMVKYITPWALISVFYFLLRILVLNFEDLLDGFDHNSLYDSHPWFRVLTFTKVMLNYFRLLFIPLDLHMAWEVETVTSFFNGYVLGFLSVVAVIAFICVKTWKHSRLITFGFLWFFVILAPRTNIMKMNRPMYEHWLYLPLAGFFLALFVLAMLVHCYIKKKNQSLGRYVMYSAWAVVAICLIWLAVLTVDRNNDWQNPIIFYENNLQYTPNSYIQHNNLGMAYAEAGEYQKAIDHYSRSVELKSKYPQVYYNMGNAYRELGEVDKAIEYYQRSIQASPRFYFPYNNLLNIYVSRGDRDRAFSLLQDMGDKFDHAQYFYTRGVVFYRFGEYGKAIASWEKILEDDPGNIKVKMLIYDARDRL